jgi:archaemetzincin
MNVVQLLPILGINSDGSGPGLKAAPVPNAALELSPDLGPSLGLNRLARAISAEFQVLCEVAPAALDPAPSFHSGRQQYYSTDLLARMQKHLTPACWRVLGVTPLDLYIPILTFVFGEAQLEGGCALVSTYRLRQEFYGLPPDPDLLRQRLLKEAIHELGHTLGLSHCEDYECVMAPSHAVEWIDLKSSHVCRECRRTISSPIAD